MALLIIVVALAYQERQTRFVASWRLLTTENAHAIAVENFDLIVEEEEEEVKGSRSNQIRRAALELLSHFAPAHRRGYLH
jgi:hypothetical protein